MAEPLWQRRSFISAMSDAAKALGDECQRQSESCSYTAVSFTIWLRCLCGIRTFATVAPIIFGALATWKVVAENSPTGRDLCPDGHGHTAGISGLPCRNRDRGLHRPGRRIHKSSRSLSRSCIGHRAQGSSGTRSGEQGPDRAPQKHVGECWSRPNGASSSLGGSTGPDTTRTTMTR